MKAMKNLAYGIVGLAAFTAASAFAAGTLPAGYTEVEYIQGDGSSTRILVGKWGQTPLGSKKLHK